MNIERRRDQIAAYGSATPRQCYHVRKIFRISGIFVKIILDWNSQFDGKLGQIETLR